MAYVEENGLQVAIIVVGLLVAGLVGISGLDQSAGRKKPIIAL